MFQSAPEEVDSLQNVADLGIQIAIKIQTKAQLRSLDCHPKFPAKMSPGNDQQPSLAREHVYKVYCPPIG